MSIRRQLATLLSLALGGLTLLGVSGIACMIVMRNDITRLSEKTSPVQVNLAKLQRAFERISGNFARVSAADSEQEIQTVQADTEETLRQVDEIAMELAKTSNSVDATNLEEIRNTHAALREMASERLSARHRIAESYQRVAHEISWVVATTQELARAMADLQKKSQDGLLKSKKTSQDANTSIKAMLVLREKLGQIQQLMQEVRLVDKKFRLNVLRDKAKGVLDIMASQDLPDSNMQSQTRAFVDKFDPAFQGDNGLLAARAEVIANPQDAKAKDRFEEKEKSLNAMVDAQATKLIESIDPLELSVQTANTSMNKATEWITVVSSVAATTAEVNAHARTIQGLAWQLLAAGDLASVERAKTEIVSQEDLAQRNLAEMTKCLTLLQRNNDINSAAEASKAFQRVRERLVGASGVAAMVRQGLEQQANAEHMFTTALQTIRYIAQTGSERARNAEGAQAEAVTRIHRLSTSAIYGSIIVGLLVIFNAGFFGLRIQKSILAAEAEQVRANDEMRTMVDMITAAEAAQRESNESMRRMVTKLTENTRSLRRASQELTSSCESATGSMDSIADAAREMQSSVQDVSSSAMQAASVGTHASEMIHGAWRTFESLRNASEEITRATETIRKISSKTNLLALNAMIEAARAGEMGRGFAVVADEVKNLARQVAEASTDIDGRVDATRQQVESVQEVFQKFKSYIEQIGAMQQSIAAAVNQETAATQKIGANIEQTAVQLSGNDSTGGIRKMARSLSLMASELEELCHSRAA